MTLIFEIEKNLSHYITREYEKLESKDKQRNFIENFRFLMMSNDTDFQNFYSKKSLNDREFYSIVDSLYQLNNLCMLAEFVTCNKPLLIYEVQKWGIGKVILILLNLVGWGMIPCLPEYSLFCSTSI